MQIGKDMLTTCMTVMPDDAIIGYAGISPHIEPRGGEGILSQVF